MHRLLVPIKKPSGSSSSDHGVAAVASQTPTSPAPASGTRPTPSTSVPQNHAACGSETLDLNSNTPSQPILNSYPKCTFGSISQAFNAGWYRSRPWLEYSLSRDACFCFPCRKFSVANERDVVFTSRGYTDWKAALERDRGLQKHASSQCHVQAMATWSELKCREASGETIDCMLVGKTQLEKNRYYLKSIGGVVKFLCINEPGLRGTTETTSNNDTSAGLFLNLFEYTLEKDAFLADIVKGIPKHKYTSKDIQNEIIETLADMVLSEIKHRYTNADSAGFCLKSDGTRDKCNVENLSVMIRLLCNSLPEEHLIGLLDLHQLDAEYISNQILSHLSAASYSADNIVSQCYDGASVMSGVRGGVQALLQNKLGRYIPYIHCYNHQLHLAVVHAIQSDPCGKKFFDFANSLYSFFHHH